MTTNTSRTFMTYHAAAHAMLGLDPELGSTDENYTVERVSLARYLVRVAGQRVGRVDLVDTCACGDRRWTYTDERLVTDTSALELLRNFAMSHGEIAFAHLVTAALAGEEWAVERIDAMTTDVGRRTFAVRRQLAPDTCNIVLAAIRSTDTTRPDDAIARRIEV